MYRRKRTIGLVFTTTHYKLKHIAAKSPVCFLVFIRDSGLVYIRGTEHEIKTTLYACA